MRRRKLSIGFGMLLLSAALLSAGCGFEPDKVDTPSPRLAPPASARGIDEQGRRVGSPANLKAIQRAAKPYRLLSLYANPRLGDGGRERASKEAIHPFGVNVEDVWFHGSNAALDLQVQNALEKGVNGICIDLDLVSPTAAWLKKAQERRVVVIGIDLGRTIGQDLPPYLDGVVGVDGVTEGRIAGQAMEMLLGGRGDVAVIGETLRDDASIKGFMVRENGTLNVIEALHTSHDPRSARAAVSDLVYRYPKLGGIFCTSEALYQLTQEALTRQKAMGAALIVSGDTAFIRSKLESGALAAIVNPQVEEIKADAVRMAIGILDGKIRRGDRCSTQMTLEFHR